VFIKSCAGRDRAAQKGRLSAIASRKGATLFFHIELPCSPSSVSARHIDPFSG